MKFSLLLECPEAVDKFYTTASCMSNADFDIHSILHQYIEYREQGIGSIRDHCYKYGFSEADREDGEILFTAISGLFESLDRLIGETDKVVSCVSLSNAAKEIMVVMSCA